MAEEGVPPAGPAPPVGPGTISKALAIVLAIVLLVVGIGVGWFVGVQTAPAPAIDTRPQQATFNKIFSTGVMVVGTDAAFPPFEDIDPDTGEIVGFDIDLIREIAAFMGVRVEIRDTGWDPLFTLVPDRELDLAISAMTITDERNNTFLFSSPYFFSDLSLIIRPDGPMDGVINSVEDLGGRSVAFQEFTTSDGWVEDNKADLGIQDADIVKTELFTDAILLLQADEVDAVIIDLPVAEGYAAADQVKIVQVIETGEAFGIPMPRGELALGALVNAALEHLMETGVYDALVDKWFGPAEG